MVELSFHVRSWSVWSLGRETKADWLAWANNRTPPEPILRTSAATVPVSLRRRVSPLGQAALRCAWGLEGAADSRIVMA